MINIKTYNHFLFLQLVVENVSLYLAQDKVISFNDIKQLTLNLKFDQSLFALSYLPDIQIDVTD